MAVVDHPWIVCIDFGTSWCKAVAAAPHPSQRRDLSTIRPLRMGEPGSENAMMLRSLLYLENERVFFGHNGWARLRSGGDAREREALLSFKSLLAASDLSRSMDYGVSRRIDPDGAFRSRDLLVLFLAFLIHRLYAAQSDDAVLARSSPSTYRWASPHVLGQNAAIRHAMIARMFDEAFVVAEDLADALANEDGVSFVLAQKALRRAASTPSMSRLSGVIHEAMAAATCRLAEDASASEIVVVLDVGAGTSHVGAYVIEGGGAQPIGDSLRTFSLGGDIVDRVLVNMLARSADGPKDQAELDRVWRSLLPRARELKEAVFDLDNYAPRLGEVHTTIKRRAVENSPEFKEFVSVLSSAYQLAVREATAHAAAHKLRRIGGVITGGGAWLPALQSIVRKTPSDKLSIRMQPLPTVPDWAKSSLFEGRLGAAFPQLCVAIGGAIAPPHSITQVKAMPAPLELGAI
jgi:hypothetical protein